MATKTEGCSDPTRAGSQGGEDGPHGGGTATASGEQASSQLGLGVCSHHRWAAAWLGHCCKHLWYPMSHLHSASLVSATGTVLWASVCSGTSSLPFCCWTVLGGICTFSEIPVGKTLIARVTSPIPCPILASLHVLLSPHPHSCFQGPQTNPLHLYPCCWGNSN